MTFLKSILSKVFAALRFVNTSHKDLYLWLLNLKARYALVRKLELKWWMVIFLRQFVNGISLFIGLCLGTLWTIGMYDDGLERVLDVYHYFKRPPRG